MAAKQTSEDCCTVSGGIFGDITKALRIAWTPRVVDGGRDIIVDESKIRQLFNDLKLYPSKSQVYEMVHCAREGDQRSDFLTFGEFCIFATELRKHYDKQAATMAGQIKSMTAAAEATAPTGFSSSTTNPNVLSQKKSSTGCSYDVFLGGSCNPTTWRRDIAIPHFKVQGITFYNPQQSNWVPEMIELEHQAKQTSQILFFVVNDKTRNVVSMIEVSYLAGKKRKLICVLGKYPETNHQINSEPLSKTEWLDLQGGLTVVNDLVERQGMPVFDTIDVALECATKVIKQGLAIEDLGLKDGARPVQHADLQIGDRIVRLREAFDALDTARTGKISLNDLRMAFRIHVHRDLTSADIKTITGHYNASLVKEGGVDFNSFCCIVAEFKKGQTTTDLQQEQQLTSDKAIKSKRRRVRTFFSRVFHRSTSSKDQQQAEPDKAALAEDQSAAPFALLREGTACGLQSRRGSSVRDVYLGGSVNGSWRQDIAVPMLKKHGLTYFNPQAVTRRLMPMWAAAVDNSRVLLFVILGNSRSVGAMNEAAFHIGQGHNVVLVVQSIKADSSISGDSPAAATSTADDDAAGSSSSAQEILTKPSLKDYNRGRSYLSDIANREGVPVFDNVSEALHSVVQKCKAHPP
jgi:hypothetical protein